MLKINKKINNWSNFLNCSYIVLVSYLIKTRLQFLIYLKETGRYFD